MYLFRKKTNILQIIYAFVFKSYNYSFKIEKKFVMLIQAAL